MGLSVMAITPPNEEWEKMKTIWEACEAANVEVPAAVDQFFDGMPPDEKGVVLFLNDLMDGRGHHLCLSLYTNEEMEEEGYEVDLSKLPKGVTFLRFVYSR
jgi:hypothetical protein